MAQSVQLKSMAPQHYSLVQFILAHMHERGWRQKACKQFSITASWLSIVTKSDVFREEFNRQLTEHNTQVTRELAALRTEVARKAYERLMLLLDDDDVDDRLVHDIARDTAKSLGFAPSPGNGPSIEREFSRTATREVSPGVLETARITYRKVVDGEEVQQLPAFAEE